MLRAVIAPHQNFNMIRVGFGTRVFNFIVDTLLIFGITYIANRTWDMQVMYWHYPFLAFYQIFWIIMFLYYTLFEGIFKRSPAKWITKCKVFNNKGGKAAFWQILIRSLVRLTIIDCFFIPFLDKTLHDYLSKTEVVEV